MLLGLPKSATAPVLGSSQKKPLLMEDQCAPGDILKELE